MRRVVITGMGALTPIGLTINDYWNGLKTGESGAATITKFNTEKFKKDIKRPCCCWTSQWS